MGITVLKHNVPWGPFTRTQIQDGLARGDFTLQYLAHAPGLKEWLPLGEVLHFIEREPLLPPVPAARDLPPIPPSPPPPELQEPRLIQAPPVPVMSLPPPVSAEARRQASPPIAPPVPRTEVQLDTASFFRRAIAFTVDCAVLFVPIIFLFGLGALTVELQGLIERSDPESMRQEWLLLDRDFHRLLLLVALGLAWIYAASLEASPWQATIGKLWVGIKVTDAEGERVSFMRATGRHLGKFLSALPCFLGFAVALFSSRGLTLHDRLADTRVIRK
ncbi:MAG: RDD family protein [Methylacidiphilales bacterium]|nr:RDD family protein [Candidatus Methylacidiphilales bacterium]